MSYSLVAGAALVAAGHADAGIVYSGPQNITVDAANPNRSIDFDGSPADFDIRFAGWGTTYSSWGNSLNIQPNTSNEIVPVDLGKKGRYAANFAQSAMVDACAYWGGSNARNLAWASYTSYYGSGSGGYFLGTSGYIGVRFGPPGDQKYGWIAFGANSDASVGIITGWAHEDSGDPIHVGDTGGGGEPIPEPSGLALLAAGAAGLASMRKKRS